MSLDRPPGLLDNLFYWVTTHRPGIGKALAFAAPVVVFVVVVTSFTGGGDAKLAPRVQTRAATPIPAQPGVRAASAPQSPTPGQPAVTATATATPTLSATATSSPIAAESATYTVLSGDTPLAIAEKLKVPRDQRSDWAQQLLALNSVSSTGLQVGQVLKLPANTPSGDQPGPLQPTPVGQPRAPTPILTRSPG